MVRLFKIILLSQILAQSMAFAASDKKEDSGATPNFGASGFALLTSNFIDRGLAMTAEGPAINAQLLMHMGSQFKLGFWGSNVSNLNNPDDNVWIRYVGEIKIDFKPNMNFVTYVHDHHYYKSDTRNGLTLGVKVELMRFSGMFELINNYEGTHTGAEYINLGYTHRFKDSLRAAGYVGYTQQKADGINDYIDIKAVGIYQPLPNFHTDLGVTLTSDSGQLNQRGKFGYYLSFNFDF